jgi:hypothetical protein
LEQNEEINALNWPDHVSIELLEEQIRYLRFEFGVATGPIAAFSFGKLFLSNDPIPSLIYWAIVSLSISLFFTYVLISITFSQKKFVHMWFRNREWLKKEMIEGRVKMLPVGHPGQLFLAKMASFFLTVGYGLVVFYMLAGREA